MKENQKPKRELIGITEAAELLMTSPQNVHYWIRRGDFLSFKIGTKWKLDKSSVLDFMANGKQRQGLSAEEVAAQLGMSEAIIYRMVTQKKLTTIDDRKPLRFSQEEIDRYIETCLFTPNH